MDRRDGSGESTAVSSSIVSSGIPGVEESAMQRMRFWPPGPILTLISAAACLVADILTVAGTQVAIFAMAFYRTQFAVPREWTAGIYEVAVIIYIVAPLVSGRLINRFGAKRLAVANTLLAAFFTMTFFFVPNVWLAFAFDMPQIVAGLQRRKKFVYLCTNGLLLKRILAGNTGIIINMSILPNFAFALFTRFSRSSNLVTSQATGRTSTLYF
jgi:MFS family permease